MQNFQEDKSFGSDCSCQRNTSLLPDFIADILPGEYPIHTKDGVVEQNFKGRVLKIVTGDFNLIY